MQIGSPPTKIPLPFANSGTKNVIPESAASIVTPGQASLDVGFPALTFTPLASGGVPPFGADFNGILNLLAQTVRWVNAGGTFKYDATFAGDANVNGYPAGAVLLNSAGTGFWLNTVDNNATNPDTGGAGWQLISAGRLLNIQVFGASGTYTPTAGTTSIEVEVIGAGGAGGGSAANASNAISAGAGGGGGGYARSRITSGFAGTTVTVGGGGTGTAGGTGGNGNSSSFGSFLSASGGSGGSAGPTSAGTVTTFNGSAAGGTGVGGNIITGVGGIGAYALYVTNLNSVGGNGGASIFGGGGAGASGTGSGLAGGNFGAGGGGAAGGQSASAQAGGNGKSGIVIIREYA